MLRLTANQFTHQSERPVKRSVPDRFILNKQRAGFSLVELVVIIVVLSIALTGLISVFSSSILRSADPVLQQQAIAVAQSYLEEILLKAYSDPDGSNSGESRATYDDIQDYNGLTDTGARDQYGNVLAGLANYTVSVTVNSTTLGSQNVAAFSVVVTVAYAGTSLNLTGYKAAL